MTIFEIRIGRNWSTWVHNHLVHFSIRSEFSNSVKSLKKKYRVAVARRIESYSVLCDLDSSINGAKKQEWIEQEENAKHRRGDALKIYEVQVNSGKLPSSHEMHGDNQSLLVPTMIESLNILQQSISHSSKTGSSLSWLHMGLELEQEQ